MMQLNEFYQITYSPSRTTYDEVNSNSQPSISPNLGNTNPTSVASNSWRCNISSNKKDDTCFVETRDTQIYADLNFPRIGLISGHDLHTWLIAS